jgi:hypothetical protein
MTASCVKQETIGVIFALHGGFDTYKSQYLWDSSVQMFSYDPNHPVYSLVIWNPDNWTMVLQPANAPKEIQKYSFEYQRLGGTDPFTGITAQQFENLKTELESQANSGDLTLCLTMCSGCQVMISPIMPIPGSSITARRTLPRNAPTAVRKSPTGHGPAATRSATMLTGRSTG